MHSIGRLTAARFWGREQVESLLLKVRRSTSQHYNLFSLSIIESITCLLKKKNRNREANLCFGGANQSLQDSQQTQGEWDPILQEMLSLKAKYKQVTGKDFGPPRQEKKSKATATAAVANQQQQQQQQQEEASDKNKEKRAAKAAAKAEKEAKKAAQRAERERREREKAERLAGKGQDNFGDAPLVQSQDMTQKIWTAIEHLKPALAGEHVLVRGHLQISRTLGKGVFVLVRSSLYSVQGVAFENNSTISKAMIQYIAGLPAESVVDMKGKVTVPDKPIESATQKMVEIQITDLHCICKAKQALPFDMEDACRPDTGKETDVGEYNEDDEELAAEDGLIRVGQKMRLDYRWLDLRTPANQAILSYRKYDWIVSFENASSRRDLLKFILPN